MIKCKVSVIMGSQSDWKIMQLSCKILDALSIPYENKIISAHRTPKRLYKYASLVRKRGIKVIIAGAGGAAHLPGMVASLTSLPVIGVPIKSGSLSGVDSTLSILQMPKGCPVATMAIGNSGAINAALYSASILALSNKLIQKRLEFWHLKQSQEVQEIPQNE